jgi:hypothetical protein
MLSNPATGTPLFQSFYGRLICLLGPDPYVGGLNPGHSPQPIGHLNTATIVADGRCQQFLNILTPFCLDVEDISTTCPVDIMVSDFVTSRFELELEVVVYSTTSISISSS